jgi:hypothetical protein
VGAKAGQTVFTNICGLVIQQKQTQKKTRNYNTCTTTHHIHGLYRHKKKKEKKKKKHSLHQKKNKQKKTIITNHLEPAGLATSA